MAIEATVDVRFRGMAGSGSPGEPAGIWFGQITVSGDGSGGDQSATIVFRNAADSPDGRFYSCETALGRGTSGTNSACSLQFVNFDEMPGVAGALANAFLMALQTTEEASPRFMTQINVAHPQIFMGQESNHDARLAVTLKGVNVNGSTLTLYATGYWWEPGARNATGGVRRPGGGFFP